MRPASAITARQRSSAQAKEVASGVEIAVEIETEIAEEIGMEVGVGVATTASLAEAPSLTTVASI